MKYQEQLAHYNCKFSIRGTVCYGSVLLTDADFGTLKKMINIDACCKYTECGKLASFFHNRNKRKLACRTFYKA
jgi:hypothetical protein